DADTNDEIGVFNKNGQSVNFSSQMATIEDVALSDVEQGAVTASITFKPQTAPCSPARSISSASMKMNGDFTPTPKSAFRSKV
ncbi:hypothetical protein ACFL6C_14690, partial [Myxococcota bacterium]